MQEQFLLKEAKDNTQDHSVIIFREFRAFPTPLFVSHKPFSFSQQIFINTWW
jgi:hypothetical protein